MDGFFEWHIIEHSDGSQDLDGAHFSTPKGNLLLQIRPEDRPIRADDAGKAKVKAKLREMAELLLDNMDKI